MIENQDRKNIYDGNGLNDLWPFTFEVSTTDGSDIAVYLTNGQGVTGDRLESGYSVDMINKRVKYPDPAGTILPAGWKITLARETPLTQTVSLKTQSFDPKSMEFAADRLTMMVQELAEQLSRTLSVDIASSGIGKLPPVVPGRVLGWNDDGHIVNYLNSFVAAGIASFLIKNIADLKAVPLPTSTMHIAVVQGYYAEGDGGGGVFFWDAASTAADNGGTIIRPDTNPVAGRWIRITGKEALNVLWFGAKGDGVTNDATAFVNAVNALPAYGGTVLIPPPPNYYYLGNAVNITKRCRLLGGGKLAAVIKTGPANSAFLATFAGGYLEFENLYICGADTTGSNGYAIKATGTGFSSHMSFVRIQNCYIRDFATPVETKYADHVYLQDVFYYQGVSGLTAVCYKHSFGTGITYHNVKTAGSGEVYPARSLQLSSDVDTFEATDCNFYRSGGVIVNNVESGSSFAPRYIKFQGVVVEPNKGASEVDDSCFSFHAGRDIKLCNCTGMNGCYGIYFTNVLGLEVLGGTYYLNRRHGIYHLSGSTDIRIIGAVVVDNSQETTNAYSGIVFPAGSSKFSIIGCTIASGYWYTGNIQLRGITINNDCTDFLVMGNKLWGSTTQIVLGMNFSNYLVTNNLPSTYDFNSVGGKKHFYGTAAPGSGAWVAGDVVWNTNPTAGGYAGWICVSPGSPGTWKGFGLIQS